MFWNAFNDGRANRSWCRRKDRERSYSQTSLRLQLGVGAAQICAKHWQWARKDCRLSVTISLNHAKHTATYISWRYGITANLAFSEKTQMLKKLTLTCHQHRIHNVRRCRSNYSAALGDKLNNPPPNIHPPCKWVREWQTLICWSVGEWPLGPQIILAMGYSMERDLHVLPFVYRDLASPFLW